MNIASSLGQGGLRVVSNPNNDQRANLGRLRLLSTKLFLVLGEFVRRLSSTFIAALERSLSSSSGSSNVSGPASILTLRKIRSKVSTLEESAPCLLSCLSSWICRHRTRMFSEVVERQRLFLRQCKVVHVSVCRVLGTRQVHTQVCAQGSRSGPAWPHR
jgi:hypothetical protein